MARTARAEVRGARLGNVSGPALHVGSVSPEGEGAMLPPFNADARRVSSAAAIALAGGLLGFGLAACAGTSGSVPARTSLDSARAAQTAVGPRVTQSAVYVSDGGAGLLEYPMNADGTLGAPFSVTLPRLGNPFPPNVVTFGPDSAMYVVGHYANKVFKYQQNASGMWSFAYSLEPIFHSDSIVVDGKAYLYASGFPGGSATQVQVYPPGANGFVNPIVVIPGDSTYCCDVAVWAEQLYVSGTGIRVYSTPYSKPVLKRTITKSGHFGGPVALDKSSELYVGNGPNVFAYSPFATGNAKPDRIIYTGSAPMLNYEVSMVVAGQNLYVGSTVWLFNSQVGRQRPKQVVTGIGTNPLTMAIGPLSAPGPTPSPSPTPVPTATPTPGPVMFVSAQGSLSEVLLFAYASNPHLLGSISIGIDNPEQVAADAAGTLYVANKGTTGNRTVTVYPLGQGTPSLTLTKGLVGGPVAVAVDPQGTVSVGTTSRTGNNKQITEYLKGNTTPFINFQSGVVVQSAANDTSGNLYLTSPGNVPLGLHDVLLLPKGSQTLQQMHLHGLVGSTGPFGVAFDHENRLYVQDSAGIYEYQLGNLDPIRTIATSLPNTLNIALDVFDDLFVPAGNSISVYAANQSQPFETIQMPTGETAIGVAASEPAQP
jgi:hypothetical protein